MAVDYVAHARRLDARHHGLPAPRAQTHAGLVGPVLRALRAFPSVRGLVWGAYSEASADVHALLSETATSISEREWGMMGSRSRSEARGMIVSILRRRWGVTAAREAARLRISRFPLVGAQRAGAAQMLADGRVFRESPAYMAGVAPRGGALGAAAF